MIVSNKYACFTFAMLKLYITSKSNSYFSKVQLSYSENEFIFIQV